MSSRLLDFTIQNSLLLPEEDRIPALYEVAVGSLYRHLGVKEIVIGNHWHDEWKTVTVDRFLDPVTSVVDSEGMPGPKCTYSGRHEIVTVSCLNDPYTIICLSPEAMAKIDPTSSFEGFWADDKTNFDWWLAG